MRTKFHWLVIAAALVVLAVPVQAQSVREQMLVNATWLEEHRDGLVLLEIGEKSVFEAGHIPGARLIELGSIVVDRDGLPNELPETADLERVFTAAGVGSDHRIVIYSRDPLHAARAWFTLDYLGAGHRASILDGGIDKWIADGRKVQTETDAFEPAAFRAQVRKESVTYIKVLRELVRWRASLGQDLVMVDARPPDFFAGKKAGTNVVRPGHIPGALNVAWSENLTSTGEYRSAAELKKLYDSINLTRSSTNIVYCRTGMEASVTYFVLKYLGYDAALYDGSFIEWSGGAEKVAVK